MEIKITIFAVADFCLSRVDHLRYVYESETILLLVILDSLLLCTTLTTLCSFRFSPSCTSFPIFPSNMNKLVILRTSRIAQDFHSLRNLLKASSRHRN